MSHLEARLEKDLNQIRSLLNEQAKTVAQSVRDAVHALQTGNRKLANATVLSDHPVNRRMRQIDRLCHQFIAVHLPSAGNLRLLSSAIRVNIELERIGDYAVTICRESLQLKAPPSGHMALELERLAGEAQLALGQSIDAFERLDAAAARTTIRVVSLLDANMDAIYGELMANTEQQAIKDLLAVFVVFTQLKRVADQAKNICEETVFAATGKQKAPKVYNILFVDEDNSYLSQMAQAIAANSYPDSGHYTSGGRNPASALSPALTEFLQGRGLDASELAPKGLDMTQLELAQQHVIVSLQGPVSGYFSPLPFHTAALEWDLGEPPEAGDQSRQEELYRALALEIKDLMELLRGEGAS
jgi:phosphate transport system protein